MRAADRGERPAPQFLLEQQDLTADRRLRNVQLRAGRGEGTRIGDGADDLELAQVHALQIT